MPAFTPGPRPDLLARYEQEREEAAAREAVARVQMEAARAAAREARDAAAEADLAPVEAKRLQDLLAERARRRVESLSIYEPLPVQRAFHESGTRTRLLRGSNRSGKTLSAAVEVARALTGSDPHGKYPTGGGRCYAIGKDLQHVGEVMWRKLSAPGAFKIIRDESTGAWRAYRPWDPRDVARAAAARPAPPLIPPRMIRSVSWEHKGEGIPSIVRLATGWEIAFYSSLGRPPQGSDLDLFWFDEEIVDPNWYPEMSARIVDRSGRGIWSATPQAGTDQLYELHERAAAERLDPPESRSVEEFVVLLADNPHIREADKKRLAADLSEDDAKVRIGGDFALLSFKIYPEFDLLVHGMDWMQVPDDWTRYMVVDPGHQVCAALFAAVPPPPDDFVLAYDELYLKECDAAQFAKAVAHRLEGQRVQSFIIDPHLSIATEAGSGKSVGRQYSDELARLNVRSAATGSSFLPGNDDVDAGLMAVRGWLRIRDDGTPRLRVMRGAMPNFEFEIKRYHRKRVGGSVTDRPDARKWTHLMDCLRYLALSDPRYVAPGARRAAPAGAAGALRAKLARRRAAEGGGYTRLGPGKASNG